ncbi:hypothetical protein FB45DRAFT_1051443 [Roridomyces roridus]|uniref:Uncharacterized protein n=1 Tax=Roridomyces roridus TaxID=1738132 RepID=A0AAD7CED1_9AGAR|nr:hypothetical protein FB45DRAFT_1051443 [Roridomyces roridus]
MTHSESVKTLVEQAVETAAGILEALAKYQEVLSDQEKEQIMEIYTHLQESIQTTQNEYAAQGSLTKAVNYFQSQKSMDDLKAEAEAGYAKVQRIVEMRRLASAVFMRQNEENTDGMTLIDGSTGHLLKAEA